MPIIECEQQTPEWLAVRIGRVTASRVCDVLATLKDPKKESADRRNYRNELVCETLTGLSKNGYVNPAMEWGIENEPLARAAYEVTTDLPVESVGFAVHPSIQLFGASPDSLVGDDGVLEIKCPETATQLQWRSLKVVPEEHKAQMYAEMACTGRRWCDFVSFDRRLPKRLRLFVRRLEWDDEEIGKIERAVEAFIAEVQAIVEFQLNLEV